MTVNFRGRFAPIHSHVDFAALSYASFSKTPVIHTIHGILTPWVEQIYTQHRQQNFVSISNSQRREDLKLNYVATVYNAIAIEHFKFYRKPDEPPHLAIAIAKRTGLPLKMAGQINFENRKFFDRFVNNGHLRSPMLKAS